MSLRKHVPAFLLLLCALLAGASPAPERRTPTPVPTPVPPPRVSESPRKGGTTLTHVARFSSAEIAFSRIVRVEEVDLDRDGDPEVLVEGIGTVKKLPDDVVQVGFVSRYRLPFESPILAILKRAGAGWRPLLLAHVPLRCGQSDDLGSCDQVTQFRSIRFRFDDRPQVVLQILHPGESASNETYAYRIDGGRLSTSFAVSLPRASVDVAIDPSGITRRLAVDTFVNRELPLRYRSFTLKTLFVFGESHFRIASETIEEPWSERADAELAYWGLAHQPTFTVDIERMRERVRKEPADAWTLDPIEVVKKRYPDAMRARILTRQSGVCSVFFERANGCHGHAVLYQPMREWEGEKSFWEIASVRGAKDAPFECLDETPLSLTK